MKYVVAQWKDNRFVIFLSVYPFPKDLPEYRVDWTGIRDAWKFDSFDGAMRFCQKGQGNGWSSGVFTECEAKARWNLYEELCSECRQWYMKGEHGHFVKER